MLGFSDPLTLFDLLKLIFLGWIAWVIVGRFMEMFADTWWRAKFKHLNNLTKGNDDGRTED